MFHLFSASLQHPRERLVSAIESAIVSIDGTLLLLPRLHFFHH